MELNHRRPAMVILAIDLGKAKSLFCWYETTEGGQELKHEMKTVPSTPAAFRQELARREVGRVVIEVCDMAGWVKDLCEELGIAIQVANANGEGWRWRNVKNKCDRTDVLKLARLSAMGQLPGVCLPDRRTRHWRSLILYRHKLVERRTAVKNSIHALLVSEGRAVLGKAAWSERSMAELRKLARPVRECSVDELWAGHLWMELEALDALDEQVATLDRKLDDLGEADARVVRLRTIPGVGPRLAELAVAVIDDPKRFASARQVSAYAGLVPRRYQSGQTDRSGRISKAGCGKLRKVLVQVAWGMLRHNERGREVFGRISKGQKTRRKQAAVALARRVLVWCWAMLRDGTDWRGDWRGPLPEAVAVT
jgi:transposase